MLKLSQNDYQKLQQYHEEFKNELLLKREQVDHLRKELDDANLKIYKLNRELEKSKSTQKETEFNLNLIVQKYQKQDQQLNEIKENLNRTILKEEMTTAEIDTLNNYLQQLSMEKVELKNKNDELEAKCRYFQNYQNDINERYKNLNKTVVNIEEISMKFEVEHQRLTQLVNEIRQNDNTTDLHKFYIKENERLRKELKDREEQLIKITAKSNKLNHLITDTDLNGTNWLTNQLLSQWKKSSEQFRQQIELDNEIIQDLTRVLSQEKLCNSKLIKQNDDYERRIDELQQKFDLFMSFKEEVIEIDNNKSTIKLSNFGIIS